MIRGFRADFLSTSPTYFSKPLAATPLTVVLDPVSRVGMTGRPWLLGFVVGGLLHPGDLSRLGSLGNDTTADHLWAMCNEEQERVSAARLKRSMAHGPVKDVFH